MASDRDDPDELEDPERWRLGREDHAHVVAIASSGTFSRTIVWTVDGQEVARKRTSEERVTLAADGHDLAVTMKISDWSDSARRVRLFAASSSSAAHAVALTGLGGEDFHPDPGTKAARRQARMAAHPTRYTIQRTATAIAGVGVPLLVIWLLGQLIGQIAFPDVDLPEIPVPDIDLPSIPMPSIDLPDVDLPALPALPGWVKEILGALKYVFPVAVAFVIAR
ncbi:MAG: hypothetical protein Q7T55_03770, partial [Solirubrobacteraceae bacterium]|nr:hypothetical protein [Solirubrobacteraceae bacterium]